MIRFYIRKFGDNWHVFSASHHSMHEPFPSAQNAWEYVAHLLDHHAHVERVRGLG